MGVTKMMITTDGNLFIKERAPLITIDPSTKEISFISHAPLQPFLKTIGIEPGDVLIAVNDVKYNLDNINELIMWSGSLKENEEVTFTIKRNDVVKKYTGKAVLPKELISGYKFTEIENKSLKEAWLKG